MKFMEATGVYALVDRAYHSSGAFQWAREAVVNALQAKATEIRFDVEWEAVKTHKVYRRTIADNGSGIPAQLMPAFLNKFGGSGRTIGDITSNYGIGFKTSCLPWNTKGVVVLSVSPDSNRLSDVNMMWLRRENHENGEADYGARDLVAEYFDQPSDATDDLISEWDQSFGENTDAITVLPLGLLKLEDYTTTFEGIDWYQVAQYGLAQVGQTDITTAHGTVIVLMGNKDSEHTFLGDQARHEHLHKYGLLRYLNTRFFTLPKDIRVGVVALGSKTDKGEEKIDSDKSWTNVQRWPRDPEKAGSSRGIRYVTGMRECLEKYGDNADDQEKYGDPQHGETKIEGGSAPVPVVIETYLYPFKPKSEKTTGGNNKYTMGTQPSLPVIACAYSCHPEISGLVETFDARCKLEGKEALTSWMNLEKIRRRMAIILNPVDSADVHIFPDQSRRTLLYQDKTKGGTPLPEDEWSDVYKKARPGFVTTEVDAFYNSLVTDMPAIGREYSERLKLFLPYMAAVVKERRRGVPRDEPITRVPHTGGGGPRIGSVRTKRGGRFYQVTYGLIMAVATAPPDANDTAGSLATPYPIQLITDKVGADGETAAPYGLVNLAHPLIQDAWSMLHEKLVADAVPEGAEMNSYYVKFQEQVLSHISLSLSHLWVWTKAEKLSYKDTMSSSALASIAAGIRHFHQACQGPFGTVKAGTAAALAAKG